MPMILTPDTLAMPTAASAADWMQGWSGVVSAAVSLGLLYQLYQTKQQVALSTKWNKMNAAFTFLQSDTILQKEREAVRALMGVRYDLLTETTPISPQQLAALRSKPEAFLDVKSLLNIAEDFATAVHLGAVDDSAAFGMMAVLITRWERLLKPYILERKATMGSDVVYCELEKLAATWNKRLKDLDKGAVSAAAGSARGVSPTV